MPSEPTIPRTNDGLADLHYDIAGAFGPAWINSPLRWQSFSESPRRDPRSRHC